MYVCIWKWTNEAIVSRYEGITDIKPPGNTRIPVYICT